MQETERVRVEIAPRRLDLVVPRGTRLLDLLAENNLVLDPCGGHGLCGRCRVRWVADSPRPTPQDAARLRNDEIEDGWRLACQHELTADARIWVAPIETSVDWKSCGHVALEGGTRIVERHLVAAGAATGSPKESEAEALSLALGKSLRWSPRTVAELVGACEAAEIAIYEADGEVLAVCPGDASAAPHAIAADIGTSVLGLYLVDLEAAQIVASESVLNPQAAHGADVLSRIAFVQSHGNQGRGLLQRLVQRELDAATERLVESAGIERRAVFHVRVAGNPTMLHLFFGIDPRPLGRAPFAPVFSGAISSSAADAGVLLADGARVDSIPAISGFVGADAVAGALCTRLGSAGETALLMDVGTNAELLLAHEGQLFACSAAAGPALEVGAFGHGAGLGIGPEGGDTSCGPERRSGPSVVRGSTLLDLLAELLDSGAVRKDGSLEGDNRALSQRAIRQIQLAIAALRSGIEQLLAAAGVRPDAVSRVVVSGSFGVRLNPRTMVRIGLLPPEWGSRVQALENAAGLGTAQTLVDSRLMEKAAVLAGAAHSIQLGRSKEYVKRFVHAMAFPPRARG